MLKKKKSKNLLALCPHLNPPYTIKKSGESEMLIMPRTSWIERLGVRWLNQSSEHRYHLDELGSFVLHHCNGQYSVSEIEEGLRQTFGEKAEPTLNRLVKFLQILDNNCVISFRQTGAD